MFEFEKSSAEVLYRPYLTQDNSGLPLARTQIGKTTVIHTLSQFSKFDVLTSRSWDNSAALPATTADAITHPVWGS